MHAAQKTMRSSTPLDSCRKKKTDTRKNARRLCDGKIKTACAAEDALNDHDEEGGTGPSELFPCL